MMAALFTQQKGNMSTDNDKQKIMPLHEQQERVAKRGDIVTIDFNLTPENGYVPAPLFDTTGVVSFVLGWGNYLPGLHSLIEGMSVDHEVKGVSIDAGWGQRNENLVVRVLKNKIKSFKDLDLLKVGSQIYLEGGIQVSVTEIDEDSIVVDGNLPLAGASFECDLKILSIDSMPSKMEYTASSTESRYQIATFALGCFWGGELAFMRTPGVVGTKVGYTQGNTKDPSYEEVCTGTTRHREAIMVVYDSSVVSYETLVEVAFERLAATALPFNGMAHDDNDTKQYSHGFFYHTEQQRIVAEQYFEESNKYHVEVLPAAAFYDAEDYHQQYLLKGGQSAKKDNKETIRCFG